jgi:DNA-binding transcriptional LysR family regulator
MDIRKLRYFAQVVEARSLSRAAGQLHVAQPALSKSIQALERELDLQLLRRSAQGVTPTEAGERLYEHCQIIFGQLERARLDVRNTGNRPSGHVVVGMPHSIAAVLGLPLLLAASERLPDIKLELIQDHSHLLTGRLRADRAHIAVMANPRSRADLAVQAVLSEELFFVIRQQDSAATGPITFADAATYGYVLPGSSNGLRATVESYFRTRGLSLTVEFEVDAIGLIPRCVAAGLGATILPGGSLSDAQVAEPLQVRPFEAGFERVVVLARNAQTALTPATSATMDLVLEVCRELVQSARWRGGSYRAIYEPEPALKPVGILAP